MIHVPTPAPRQPQLGVDPSLPVNGQEDFVRLGIAVGHDLFDQRPRDPLLERRLCGWRVPNGVEVCRQIGERSRLGSGLRLLGQTRFERPHLGERRVPTSLQLIGYEAVFRVTGVVFACPRDGLDNAPLPGLRGREPIPDDLNRDLAIEHSIELASERVDHSRQIEVVCGVALVELTPLQTDPFSFALDE